MEEDERVVVVENEMEEREGGRGRGRARRRRSAPNPIAESQKKAETHQLVVVEMILMPDPIPNTQEALLVSVPTVGIEEITVVETLPTEITHGMILRHMPLHFPLIPQLMLVGKDLLMIRAQIADRHLVSLPNVTFEVGPGLSHVVACRGGAVEPQKGDTIVHRGAGLEG